MPPFVPKSWGNFSTGGTPLNAAGLNDLEARINGAVAAPAAEDIHAYDYGVRGDGVTPSGAFLQDAVYAANVNAAKTVILPAGGGTNFIQMESAVEVPSGVSIRGQGLQGTVLKAMVGTFPINTPMFRIGRSTDTDAFGTRLENFAIDMRGIAGSTCVYSTCAEENSGLVHMGLFGWRLYGLYFQNCQNFQVRDLWVIAEVDATGGNTGIKLYDCNGYTVEGGTIATSNFTTGIGIDLLHCYTANIKQWNIEGAIIGVKVNGSHVDLEGISGDPVTTTVVHFQSGNNGCSYRNGNADGSTNLLIDDGAGFTITAAQQTLLANYEQETRIGGNRIIAGYTSTPSTSGLAAGTIALNTNPVAGGFIGWVCVTSGSPDVWKTFGVISA